MSTKQVLTTLAIAVLSFSGVKAQTNSTPAVAIEIVYDGSGSMNDNVPGVNNVPTPKFLLASNAIVSIATQIHEFVKAKKANVEAGLVPFYGGEVREGITLQKFHEIAFLNWANNIPNPDGGTPLGNAINKAAEELERSSALKKYILIVTDGENNAGPDPATVLKNLKETQPFVHAFFIAFDVNASVFDGAKAQGATVVSAANATELDTQVNTLLGQKILLEAE